MKVARFFVRFFFCFALLICILIFTAIFYLQNNISDDYKIKKGENLFINSNIPVTAEFGGIELSQSNLHLNVGQNYAVDLKAFGIIPVTQVNVEVVDEMYVAVLGSPFGMKIYTEGVLVVELTSVETANGKVSPAKDSGIKLGDYIISVNGEKITTNEDLSRIVEKSGGEKMKFLISRENKRIYINVTAAVSAETNGYKIGVWVRDSSAGIGTLTFYSPSTGIVCGLGHGICDEDTDSLLQLNSGEIVNAEILSVEKGEVGAPGQLNGKFGVNTLGKICLNSNAGVYSRLDSEINYTYLTEVALKNEISDGSAQILCTVDGNTPKLYDCKVKVRVSAFHSKTQNMIVTVTDSALLDATGGIVQGLSGSPILQNGKLIGAVTHVLIDDPTKGYGIFAENMLETAQSVGEGSTLPKKNNQLKDAS